MMDKKETVLFVAVLTGVIGGASYLFYENLILIVLLPILYRKAKGLYLAYKEKKRKNQILGEFRDFLFSLSTSFSTGRHMMEAMEEGRFYLSEIHGAKSLLKDELDWMLKAVHETDETVLDVMERFAKKMNLEDIYTFVDSFRVCRETGGDMIQAVNQAATLLSDKIYLEQEMRTLIYQKKLEGRMIAVMPFAMILFLQMMSPGYLEVMYTTLMGRFMMSVALGLNVLTVLWIERMTNIEV